MASHCHRHPVVGSPSSPPRAHNPLIDHSLSWTDDLPVCHLSGVGFATNQTYREDGFRCEDHEFEDRSIHFSLDGGVSLYGVFDGHEGSRVAAFAAQRMPAELLLGQLKGRDDEEIKQMLSQAFNSVEKGFTDSIDDLLAQKANLMLHVPEGIQQYELFNKYPELFKRIEQVEAEISGGTTAVVSLIKDTKLYVANVGCSRALLCTTDAEGILRVVQLSVDHNIYNDDELKRLASIGVDVEALQTVGHLGEANTYTRTLGDHDIKAQIRDLDTCRNATSDPMIAEPYVDGGIPLEKTGFLILMSYGLYKSLQDATGTEHVNREIASMVASEFSVQSTLNGVAQAVVDRVVRLHHDTFMTSSGMVKERCQKRKDITLLVRNFNYPLPNALNTSTLSNVNSSSTLHQMVAGSSCADSNAEVRPSVTATSTSNLDEPLTVLIPAETRTSLPQAPKSLFLYMSSNNRPFDYQNTNDDEVKNDNNTFTTTLSTTHSTCDSTQSGEDSLRPFMSKPRTNMGMDVDADGRVIAYVDFADFYRAIEEMTEAQRETFDNNSAPKPAYEPIPEEPTTPQMDVSGIELLPD